MLEGEDRMTGAIAVRVMALMAASQRFTESAI